eukprot:TRINITY_DN6646_c0_g3_i1.p1 TRINITY_DN6646_c0_g3~~TRINITY_DN6646_c0_g3_i1.p1  ORF type:complete len:2452 (-),score=696.63 TRINITY_DN6646_c0_g3_i1:107-7033(-)
MDDVEFYGSKGAAGFRQYLLNSFGSYMAGWRHMDSDNNGRPTFQEFCNRCRKMGYHGNLLMLWRELDANLNGSVSLAEIDPEAGKYMGLFKAALLRKYGDMLTAWQKGLDPRNRGFLTEEALKSCLEELDLPEQLNAKKLYNMYRRAPKGKGITLLDFDRDAARRLATGDLKGHCSGKTNMEFLDDVDEVGSDVLEAIDENDRRASKGGAARWRKELVDERREKVAEQRHQVTALGLPLHSAYGFKRALIKRCGSLVGAWKNLLDLDGNGRLTFGEFTVALDRLGMSGDVKGLWKDLLDTRGNAVGSACNSPTGVAVTDVDEEQEESGGLLQGRAAATSEAVEEKEEEKDWFEYKAGFLTLADLAPDAAAGLGEFRQLCREKYGSMLLAWCKCFDRRGIGAVSIKDFETACGKMGYEGNAKRLFRWLRPQNDRHTISLRDFDLKAWLCLSRGDFRMTTEPESPSEKRKLTDMTFEERRTGGFFHQIRRGMTASRSEELKKATLEANFPDRLIDTPEEFEALCVRTFGSMITAWRLGLDVNQNKRLGFDEFVKATRRLGYAGNFSDLWKHYAKKKSTEEDGETEDAKTEAGPEADMRRTSEKVSRSRWHTDEDIRRYKDHITLQDLDPGAHERTTRFLELVHERYEHVDNLWRKGFRKDPHETIHVKDLSRVCEKLGFEHSASQLLKDLRPFPDRDYLALWDIDPFASLKRARGHMGVFACAPKPPPKHSPTSSPCAARDLDLDISLIDDTASAGAASPSGGPGSPSKAALRRAKAKASMAGPPSPKRDKWAFEDPEIVAGVSSCSSPLESMRWAMRNRYGSTVAAWRHTFDSTLQGNTNFFEFCRAMQECKFPSRMRDLWRELAGDAKDLNELTEQRVTFKELDPNVQSILNAARNKLLGRYGSLLKAWKDGFVAAAEGKVRVDMDQFARACEEVSIKDPKRLFRLLIMYRGQRSLCVDDLEGLLIGVPAEERHNVWSEGKDGMKPRSLPKPLLDKPPPKVNQKNAIAKLAQDMHSQNFKMTTLESFKHMLELKHGSLFSAWRKAIDTDETGSVSLSEWTTACNTLGVENVSSLWGELKLKRPGKITMEEMKELDPKVLDAPLTLKDLDPEVAEAFGSFEALLVEKYGSAKGGWVKCFERPEPRSVKVTKEKFVQQCGVLGYAGSPEKLWKMLRPDLTGKYLTFEDLWRVEDRNEQRKLYGEMISRAAARATEPKRIERMRGTASVAEGAAYACQGQSRGDLRSTSTLSLREMRQSTGSGHEDAGEASRKSSPPRSPKAKAEAKVKAAPDSPPQAELTKEERLRERLRQGIQAKRGRVIDTFRDYDIDGSGAIDKSEFVAMLEALELDFTSEDVSALLAYFDPDGSGTVEYREFRNALKKDDSHSDLPAVLRPGAVPVQVDRRGATEHPERQPKKWLQSGSEASLREQLQAMLNDNKSRVMDFFLKLDKNENGLVDRREFGTAMRQLGLDDVSEAEMDAFFESFDPDHSGSIDYRELNAKLRNSMELPEKLRAGAVEVKTTRTVKTGGKTTSSSKSTGKTTRKASSRASTPKPAQEEPRQESLQDVLRRNLMRVIDLFRRLDEDGDGHVTQQEFRRGLLALGILADPQDIQALYPDDATSFTYPELRSRLQTFTSADGAASEAAAPEAEEAGTKERPRAPPVLRADSELTVQEQLREYLHKNKTRVREMFKKWDEDGDGTVTKKEFRMGMRAFGLEDSTREQLDELFASFDKDGGGTIDFKELDKAIDYTANVQLKPKLLPGAVEIQDSTKNKIALRGSLKEQSSVRHVLRADDEVPVRAQLREYLDTNLIRVLDLFRKWDDNGDGFVSKKEFLRALMGLGLDAPAEEVSSLFDEFDVDGSGRIEYEEMDRLLRKGQDIHLPEALRAGSVEVSLERNHIALRGSLDEQSSVRHVIDNNSDIPVIVQLRQHLDAELLRVTDLFKRWDDDGSGEVSKREFRRALHALGMEASKEELEALFDSLDADASGSLEYGELAKAIRTATSQPGQPSPAAVKDEDGPKQEVEAEAERSGEGEEAGGTEGNKETEEEEDEFEKDEDEDEFYEADEEGEKSARSEEKKENDDKEDEDEEEFYKDDEEGEKSARSEEKRENDDKEDEEEDEFYDDEEEGQKSARSEGKKESNDKEDEEDEFYDDEYDEAEKSAGAEKKGGEDEEEEDEFYEDDEEAAEPPKKKDEEGEEEDEDEEDEFYDDDEEAEKSAREQRKDEDEEEEDDYEDESAATQEASASAAGASSSAAAGAAGASDVEASRRSGGSEEDEPSALPQAKAYEESDFEEEEDEYGDEDFEEEA